jgi:hypothetical protein
MVNPEAAAQYVSQLRRLEMITRFIKDPRILAERINRQLVREGWIEALLNNRFDTEGASSGQPWDSLAQSTMNQRRSQGFPSAHPILQRSGLLRQAATQGKTIVTADRIGKQFRDGSAPRYIGGGGHRRKKLKRVNVEASEFFGTRIGSTGKLSDYAGALNSKRPFYGPPTREELAPIFARRRELVELTIWNLRNGRSITGIV